DEDEKRHQIQIARELEPNNPLVMGWAVGQAAVAGRHEEAVELQAEVARLDPLSAINRYNLAYHLYAAGRYEDAIAEMRRTLELNPAQEVGLQCFSLVLLRRFDAAARLARGMAVGADRLECEALFRHALGQRAESNAALAALTEEFGGTEPFRIAEVHAYRGEADEAFQWLQATSEICRDRSRFPVGCALPVTRHSPLLASLHADIRWAEWSGRASPD
ncbi:MAG TPA: hypothetical protein VGA24_11245, partial [Steroidobacteraceae bacterium]